MTERGRRIDKQSVDAMHVVEMHVDQIHMGYMRVSGDCISSCQSFPVHLF